MQVETLQEGEFLFKRGQKDEWIYVIQSGKISLLALYEGKDLTIYTVHPTVSSKGTSSGSHSLFEINLGKRRIRHSATLNFECRYLKWVSEIV